MTTATATQLARAVRDQSFQLPGQGSGPPPAYLVKPTTVARAAVRRLHDSNAAAARSYLQQVLASELSHSNPSMRGNAANTVQGLENYIAADQADGRTFQRYGALTVISLSSGLVRTTVDVVTRGSGGLSGRAVFWDGPTISEAEAEVIAYPYARAMQVTFPGEQLMDVAVWQARRNNIHFVPVGNALANGAAADAILARL